jgi:beta-galactosidase
MQHLEDKARADGIRVPLVGNHNGTFVSGKGAVDVSGWDYYPQGFDCSNPSHWRAAPNMAHVHYSGQPLFTAEFQGGAFDPWGGPGYQKCAELLNDQFANVFYKENIGAGATAQNFYMVYGGTSWGWQAIPQNYSSYDYRAPITEARQFDPKYYEDKRIGYFVTSTTPLLKTVEAQPSRLDDPRVIDIARVNPDTGTQFHLIRHGDTTSQEPVRLHATLHVDGINLRIPQESGEAISLDGRESKLLVAGYTFGGQRLVYSTSELMSSGSFGGREFLVLYGDPGTRGEALFDADAGRTATTLNGQVKITRTPGHIRLDYSHAGITQVVLTGGRKPPLLVLVADRKATEQIWRQDTPQGPVVMIGSHLLRSAAINHGVLELTGDTGQDGNAVVFAPPIASVTWNGRSVPARAVSSGGLQLSLPMAVEIRLPSLNDWKMRKGAPEIEPAFDDSPWRVADRRGSNTTTAEIAQPVLLADDYGFHVGNTWYRGHFSGAGERVPTGIRLQVKSGGTAGAYSAWLNGHFLGTIKGEEQGSFGFPAEYLVRGDNVLSVLTVDMGHDEDYDSKGENRTARGIVQASPIGAPSNAITWRIQGRQGGEGATDALRGPYNEGGLFGERQGWPQLGGPEKDWKPVVLPAPEAGPGVTWFSTRFELDLPRDQDTSLGLEINDPPGRHYRAIIYVNGWQMGNYVSDVGPQHRFPIPNGVIRPNGGNDVTIAVWNTDPTGGGLGKVSLVGYGSFNSSLGSAAGQPRN